MTIERNDETLKNEILNLLDYNKAENVSVVDLRGKTTIANYMIFANGRSAKNVSAIAQNTKLGLKNNIGVNCRLEGLTESRWVLLDAGEIIVHLFHPEAREEIKLEEHWETRN